MALTLSEDYTDLRTKLLSHIESGKPEFGPSEKVGIYELICRQACHGDIHAASTLETLLDHFGLDDIRYCFRDTLAHRLVSTMLTQWSYYDLSGEELPCSTDQSIMACSSVLCILASRGVNLDAPLNSGYSNLFHLAVSRALDDEGVRLNPVVVVSLVLAGVDPQKNINEGLYVPDKVKRLLAEHPAVVAHRLGTVAKSVRSERVPPSTPKPKI